MGFINQFTTTFGENAPANAVRGSFHFKGETKLEFVGNIAETASSGSFVFTGETGFKFTGNVFDVRVRGSFAFAGETDFTINGRAIGAREIFFKGETKFTFAARAGLPIIEPEPIVNQLSENPFSGDEFDAELLIDGVLALMRSFSYSRALNSTGANLSATLVYPDRVQISPNSVIEFNLLKKVGGEWQSFERINSAKIRSNNYSLNAAGDSLSFSSNSVENDKLASSPRRNLIVYSSSKVSINTDDLEPLYISGGGAIATQTRPFSILTLYNLFQIAFVEGCGFSSFETNIPNFEVTRCDFNVGATFLQAVAGLIGVFEPVFYAVGDVLYIIDKTQKVPEEIEIRSLEKAEITSLAMQSNAREPVDGFIIQFTSSAGGSTSTRTKTFIRDYITYRNETTETYKDWKDADGNILRTELIKKRVEKKSDFTLSVEEIEHTFDGQGKKTLTIITKQSRVPNPNANYDRILTDISDVRIEYTYAASPQNSRRLVPREIITKTSGLVVVDAENQYLGENFTQDIMLADRAGNISEGMTTAYVPIKTQVETFTPNGFGQIESTKTVVDHLRGSIPEDVTDTRSGDISLNAMINKPLALVVFRDGVTAANKTRPLAPFAIGEMPLVFGKALAVRKLAELDSQPYRGSVNVPGFDENLELGVYFSLPDRQDDSILGKFITESFTISGDFQTGISTTIEVAQVV